MNRYQQHPSHLNPTVENLSQAIFVVNRHAKTATDPRHLYKLKHDSLKKLMEEGKAKKVGLHFSGNPKNSQQQSDILIECGKYLFHLPPTKKDFQELPHLGSLSNDFRNPKSTISLNQAKKLLIQYTGIKEPDQHDQIRKKKYVKPVFKKLGESY
ncbi:MAG: YkyB family protein [Bacillus sp. (in: firmicutes)]